MTTTPTAITHASPTDQPPVTSKAGAIDWSLGHYEHTAAQLLPGAHRAVNRAAPTEGERVLDVGCGTGNAALLAAARGAHVTGVDPAPRLLEIARERATAQGLDATFAPGDAAALPLADGAADLVLSVFGVIFAPDAAAAAAEIARVTAPTGRVVLTAWVPEGAIHDAMRMAQDAVRRAVGAPPSPPPFAWHDRDALAALLAPYGFEVAVDEQRLAFTASSPSEHLEREAANHPLAVAGRAILEPRGEAETLGDGILSIYEAANEDPDSFRVTSRYIVATARHPQTRSIDRALGRDPL
jgi:SAM-dependent methyltransferase